MIPESELEKYISFAKDHQRQLEEVVNKIIRCLPEKSEEIIDVLGRLRPDLQKF